MSSLGISGGRRYERPLVAQIEAAETSTLEISEAIGSQLGKNVVRCIQAYGPGRFQVSLDTEETLQKLISDGILVANQRVFPVALVQPARWMTVRYAPYEMPREDIVSCFKPYGEVLWQELVVPPEIAPITNGDRRIKIRMKSPVPNFVKWGPYTLMVTYKGVARTCRKCGKEGHLAGTCTESACFGCGQNGHWLRDCPTSRQREEDATRDDVNKETLEKDQKEKVSDLEEDSDENDRNEENNEIMEQEETDDSPTPDKSGEMEAGSRKEETSTSEGSDSSIISVKKQAITRETNRVVLDYEEVPYDQFREGVLTAIGKAFIRAKWVDKEKLCIEYVKEDTIERTLSEGIHIQDKIVGSIDWNTDMIWTDDEEKEKENEVKKKSQRRSRKYRKK